jgi:hypothetical protein
MMENLAGARGLENPMCARSPDTRPFIPRELDRHGAEGRVDGGDAGSR